MKRFYQDICEEVEEKILDCGIVIYIPREEPVVPAILFLWSQKKFYVLYNQDTGEVTRTYN